MEPCTMALAYDPLRTRAVDLEKSLAWQACRQGTGCQFTAQVAGRLRMGYAISATMEAQALFLQECLHRPTPSMRTQ